MHDRKAGLKNRIKGIAKAILIMSMSLVTPLTLLPASAAQNTEIPDPDRIGSISITFTYYDENSGKTMPVTGGNSVGLYKVADVVVENGFKYVADERFAGAGEIPDTDEALDAANFDLATKMASIAENYPFDVKSKEMDSGGRVSFDGLEVGLYLVAQDAQGKGNNKITVSPFLITIPQKNPDGSLSYDADAQAKPLRAAGEEVPPPPAPPTPRRIPQTGQLWWPVIALGGTGILVICFGVLRKNRNNE